MGQAIKSVFLLTIFLLIHSDTDGQILHIYYNLHNDDVKYEKEGQIIDNPIIKNGDDIILHITEFNNYLYTLELDISNEQVIQESNGPSGNSLLSNLIPSLSPSSSFSDSTEYEYNSSQNFLDIPLITINDNPLSLSSLFGGRGSDALLKELENFTSSTSDIIAEMDLISEELNLLRQTIIVNELAKEYAGQLKVNKNLSPSFIKGMCEDYYEAIFRKNPFESIELSDVLTIQSKAANYQVLNAELFELNAELNKKISTLDLLSRQFKSANVEETESYKRYSKQLTEFLQKSKTINAQLENESISQDKLSSFPSTFELSQLQLQLAEIISNEFTYHSRIKVTGDRLNINIKVYNANNEFNPEPELVKSRWLNFESKGGLKFTGSVGLNFSQFFNRSQSYSVDDGVIIGENDGIFAPTLASFLHFYSYTGKKTSFGGALGVGIPLTGTGDGQTLQFFIGPSIILGTNQRMIVNFGLSGGKVDRLSKGYQVGEEFDENFGDIPTRPRYELGLFIGASFNIGGN